MAANREDGRDGAEQRHAGSDAAGAPGRTPTSVIGARLLAGELARSGIAGVCIAPGSRSTPLALAFAEQAGTRVFSHLDERCAGFFALGLAKAAHAPVVLVCTSGTAAANFLPAVIEAAQSAVPLIVLSADRPPELRDCGANQTIDQTRLFGTYARFFADAGLPIDDAAGHLHLRRLACRAHAESTGATPGPVHLNCPYREPLSAPPASGAASVPPAGGSVEAEAGAGAPLTQAPRPIMLPPDESLSEVAERLFEARCPLLLAGPMPPDGGRTATAVHRLARRLDAPLLAEPAANLAAPSGQSGTLLVEAGEALARGGLRGAGEPDLILRLGATPTSKAWGQALAEWRAVPQVALVAPGSWPDPAGSAGTMLRADTAATLDALAAAVETRAAAAVDMRALAGGANAANEPRATSGAGGPGTAGASEAARGGWGEQWREAGARVRAALDAAPATEPLFEGTVVRALARTMPRGSRLFVGNSLAVRALDLFWPRTTDAVEIHVSRGASGIDGLVSTTFGIAAAGGGPTVGLLGDVSLLHDIGGLLAARRTKAVATLVVLDNDGGGIFDHLPVAAEQHPRFEDLFTTPHGLDLAALAAAFGIEVKTAGAEDLDAVLAAAVRAPHTTLVRVPIDRAASHAAHRNVAALAAGASGWN